MTGRVLIIAGSDSGGGAGIQADIRTVSALGGHAMTAITALTAQNTLGVEGVMPVPAEFVRRQIEVVLDDLGADCIKTGMMHSAAIIDAAADVIEARAATVPMVVDPVMVASTGARLFDDAAVERLRERLIPRAAVLTPNLPEAELLTGLRIATLDDMRRAADRLLRLGPKAVVVKGGHLTGDKLYDLVTDGSTSWVAEAQRVETRATHGTGCTLASAIATGLAQGKSLRAAFDRAHAYLQSAIRHAPNLGQGHGPLGIGWEVAGPLR